MWSDGLTERIFTLDDRKGGNNQILWGLINGRKAIEFDRIPNEQQKKVLMEEIFKIRPSAQGNLEHLHIHSWSKSPYSAGAWSYWKPGQIKNLAPELIKNSFKITQVCFLQVNIWLNSLQGWRQLAPQVVVLHLK